MTPQVAQLIGGAGTGKTSELLRIMEKLIDTGIDPFQIGFISFTKAARAEAAGRAAEQFGVSQKALQEEGWFRTIHSICYKTLKIGKELLAGNAEARKWIESALNQTVGTATAIDTKTGESLGGYLAAEVFESSTDAGKALMIWDSTRSRLGTLKESWEISNLADPNLPGFEWCCKVIRQYEQAKRIDGRVDFTDMCGQFSGWHFRIDGPEKIEPEGYLPALPVYFHDEMQDSSALLDSVFRRLVSVPQCKYVYLSGDPFQSIFHFSGADPSCFLGWGGDGAKRRVMKKSYRCPKPILQLGEMILRDCSDYWDREIEPADHDGVIDTIRWRKHVVWDIDPSESWLLIARTNFHANRLASALRHAGIPWIPTKGKGGWNSPNKQDGLNCLYNLEKGWPIGGEWWRRAIKLLPSEYNGVELLTRGTKTKYSKKENYEKLGTIQAHEIENIGATEALVEMFRTREWRRVVEGGQDYGSAVDRWGIDVVQKPKVRVGTIHSVKGAEADNVLYLTTTAKAITAGQNDVSGADAERRVEYVAVTRARKRLIVAVEPNKYDRARLPI